MNLKIDKKMAGAFNRISFHGFKTCGYKEIRRSKIVR
jgi:hypothetical protein